MHNSQPRTFVTLGFWSQTLSPSEMTAAVGVEPDLVADAGSLPWKGGPVRASNRWELASRLPREADVEAHLSDVLSRAKKAREGLMSLREHCEAAALMIAIYPSPSLDQSPGVHLDREDLDLLTDLSAEIDIEIFTG